MWKKSGFPWWTGFILLFATVLISISYQISTDGFWKDITHEVGFALLISFLIWSLFELQRATLTEKEWGKRIESVTKNVFYAVLQKQLPKELLETTQDLVLSATFIRTNFLIHYVLSDASYKESDDKTTNCILMTAIVSYKLTNVSTKPASFTPAIRLPDPIHPDLRAKVTVKEVKIGIGDAPQECVDINDAKSQFSKKLAGASATAVTFALPPRTVAPQQSLTFSATYVMAKEAEDSEAVQTAYPSDGMHVTISDSTPGQRVILGRSIHHKDLEIQEVSGMKTFTIPGYLLPHQGMLVWWKRAP